MCSLLPISKIRERFLQTIIFIKKCKPSNILEKCFTTMPSNFALKILGVGFNIASSYLGILEICFNNQKTVERIKTRKVTQLFWIIVSIYSMILTLLELYHVYGAKSVNLVPTFYLGILLIAKVGGSLVLCICRKNVDELVQLFNVLCQNPQGVVSHYKYGSQQLYNRPKDRGFLLVLLICTVNMPLFYTIFIPTLILTLPCLHDNPVLYSIIPYECTSVVFRLIVFFMEVLLGIPIAVACVVVPTVSLIVLKEVSDNLENFRYVYNILCALIYLHTVSLTILLCYFQVSYNTW